MSDASRPPSSADPGGLRAIVERAFVEPTVAESELARRAVVQTIDLLDRGAIRVAEPVTDGWRMNAWVRMAIILYFRQTSSESIAVPPFEYRDKIPLKRDLERQGIRVVPPGMVRYGAFLEPGVVVMPAYVNIGAWVGAGSMIDTWATIGSCAQVGRNVHVSGGVGIGGVLEPVQNDPVIIEDDVFLGSRCVVVEGVRVGRGAVLGAGTVLTASTPIVDVRGSAPSVSRGAVPPEVVVIPGSMPREFAAGEFHVPCALVIGARRDSTDRKTRLNPDLREFPFE